MELDDAAGTEVEQIPPPELLVDEHVSNRHEVRVREVGTIEM